MAEKVGDTLEKGEEAGVLPPITQRDLCDPVKRFCER
jgi:hypothetical protein